MPGHFPSFSFLASQKGNQLGSTAPLLHEEAWERDALAGYNKSPKKFLSQRNIILHSAYLNSEASHGRLWKNSEANNRNILNEEQNEWRKDALLALKHGGPEATPNPRSP